MHCLFILVLQWSSFSRAKGIWLLFHINNLTLELEPDPLILPINPRAIRLMLKSISSIQRFYSFRSSLVQIFRRSIRFRHNSAWVFREYWVPIRRTKTKWHGGKKCFPTSSSQTTVNTAELTCLQWIGPWSAGNHTRLIPSLLKVMTTLTLVSVSRIRFENSPYRTTFRAQFFYFGKEVNWQKG